MQERIVAAGLDLLQGGPCQFSVFNRPAALVHAMTQQVHDVAPSRVSAPGLNNLLVVTRLTCGAHSVLLTGDIEKEGLGRLLIPAGGSVRVVKVPHHGARSSLAPAWIARLNAEVAIISAARRNSYGHPAREVLEAYGQQASSVYRTDRDGGVWIEANPQDPAIHVHTAVEQQLRPVPPADGGLRAEWENLRRLFLQWSRP